ncbi:MAG: hypothetical protein AB7E24_23970 [Novosphingobium sp.]
MIRVSAHAISRYRERVADVSYDEARAALSIRAVECAAAFGAKFVRLAGGQRIVIENGVVVTVKPATEYRRQVRRNGLGRYGRGNGCRHYWEEN